MVKAQPIGLTFSLLCVACGGVHSPQQVPPKAAPKAAVVAPQPAALRMSRLQAQQAAPGYDFAVGESGVLESRAGRGAVSFGVRATAAGVQLSSLPSAFRLGIETVGVGRAGASIPSRVLSLRAERQSLVFDRADSVEERYLAGPLGLSQSYAVAERPRGSGSLVIQVAFSGLRPAAVPDGRDRVLLRDEEGAARAGYRDLLAVDAAGRELPCHMEVQGERVALVVDDDAAIYPVAIDPVVWTVQTELDAKTGGATDGAANDFFGEAVAVSGNLAVVGAPNHAFDGHAGAGVVYIWSETGSSWTLQQELSAASDGSTNDNFGAAVSINGGRIAVGAPYHTVDGGPTEAGAVYVFSQAGAGWGLQQELLPSDPETGAGFGTSVSVNGSTLFVGSPYHLANGNSQAGTAYVFNESGFIWSPTQELTATGGKVADLFGWSVAVSGPDAIIGAYQHDVGANVSAGAAYLFTLGGSWTQQAMLSAGDGLASDFFGYSVAIDGTTAVVGAYQHDQGSAVSAGAGYIYTLSAGNWQLQQEVAASDATPGAQFGFSVAISGDTSAFGAPGAEEGVTLAQTGAVYGFTRSGAAWAASSPETAPADGVASDLMGNSVAVSGDLLIAGAPQHNDGTGLEAGAVYAITGSFSGGGSCFIAGSIFVAGFVNPASSCQVCTPASNAADWSDVRDGTGCGLASACLGGVCTSGCEIGGSPVAAGALDPGNSCLVCNPAASTSSYVSVSDGTACNDGDSCTQTDVCAAGVCNGTNPVVCSAPDACHTPGSCSSATGVCSNPTATDGTACTGGTCQSGICVPGSVTTSGSNTTAGATTGASTTSGAGAAGSTTSGSTTASATASSTSASGSTSGQASTTGGATTGASAGATGTATTGSGSTATIGTSATTSTGGLTVTGGCGCTSAGADPFGLLGLLLGLRFWGRAGRR